MAATATTTAAKPYRDVSSRGSRERYRATRATTSPPIPARAASRDQWKLHAPKKREPSPNRDQGKADRRTTRAKPIRARKSPLGRPEGRTGWGGAMSSRIVGRHSG